MTTGNNNKIRMKKTTTPKFSWPRPFSDSLWTKIKFGMCSWYLFWHSVFVSGRRNPPAQLWEDGMNNSNKVKYSALAQGSVQLWNLVCVGGCYLFKTIHWKWAELSLWFSLRITRVAPGREHCVRFTTYVSNKIQKLSAYRNRTSINFQNCVKPTPLATPWAAWIKMNAWKKHIRWNFSD